MIDRLSFVIPVHDERGAIERVVQQCVQTGTRVAATFEVVVVDDGSTDGTAEILARCAGRDPRVRVIRHPTNQGVAAATRSGFAAARGTWILYLDGDGQFDPAQVDAMLPLAPDDGFVVGFRLRRADPWHRRLNARLYNGLLRALFDLPVRDVNCACKLLRRDLLLALDLRARSAFFLAEVVLRGVAAGVPIREVGVHHQPRVADRPSGARLGVVLAALGEALAFRWRGRMP